VKVGREGKMGVIGNNVERDVKVKCSGDDD